MMDRKVNIANPITFLSLLLQNRDLNVFETEVPMNPERPHIIARYSLFSFLLC